MMRKTTQRRRGAGMTEYIIIVGLIAVGLVPVVKAYGGKIYETIVGTERAMQDGVVAPMGAGGGGFVGGGGPGVNPNPNPNPNPDDENGPGG